MKIHGLIFFEGAVKVPVRITSLFCSIMIFIKFTSEIFTLSYILLSIIHWIFCYTDVPFEISDSNNIYQKERKTKMVNKFQSVFNEM